MLVRSNCVKVTKIFNHLHVYFITFSHPRKDIGRIEHKTFRGIREAFQTLIEADVLNLEAENLRWLIDFKSLWTTEPIHGNLQIGYQFQSKDFQCVQSNGKKIAALRADVRYIDHLSDIEETLRTKYLAELLTCLRPLNASVAQCVGKHQEMTG